MFITSMGKTVKVVAYRLIHFLFNVYKRFFYFCHIL